MKTILRNTLLSILIAWSAAPAQSLFASSSKQVKAEVKLSQETFQSGSSAQVAILLTIEEGWHINAHTPTYDYLIGTSVELQTIEGVIIADIRYPEGTLQQFGFADDLLRVYDETVPIFLTLKLSDKIKPGTHTLPATVKIQACNDQVCLAPSSLSVDVLLIVAAAGESVQKKNESLFARYDEALLAGTENELAKLFATEGSFVAFLAIFLIGLALNLTPCVYPMLSVTVSLFGTQSDTNTARVFIKAVVYILGIASMYSVLGVTAAMIFPPLLFAWGEVPGELKFRFFRDLGEQTRLPLVLFQIPVRNYWYDVDTVARIAGLPNVVALKEASFDRELFAATARRLQAEGADLTLLTGNDRFVGECLEQGVVGTLLGITNVATAEWARLMALARAGDFAGLRAAEGNLRPLQEVIFGEPIVEAVSRIKTVLRQEGIIAHGYVRPPQMGISPEEARDLLRRYEVVRAVAVTN